jgi:hypothetical protein
MTPTDHHDASYEHNENVGHEHSDVNIRTVLLAAVALVTVTAVVMVIVWGVFRVLAHQAAANDPQLSPLAIPTGQLPPEPRLQTNEYAGLKKFRETETKTLEEYGWVDQKAGVAHMPIEEAKKLLLERGLPSRPGPGDPLEGTTAPAYGEANGGRTLARKQ